MKHIAMIAMFAFTLTLLSGCQYLQTGTTDLEAVAKQTGMSNITTGDGVFPDYQAVSYAKGMEIGIGVGIPFIGKLIEIWPAQSNEDLLASLAEDASSMGADAMINVTPPKENYWGFPFVIVGLYIDSTDGTGIDVK